MCDWVLNTFDLGCTFGGSQSVKQNIHDKMPNVKFQMFQNKLVLFSLQVKCA